MTSAQVTNDPEAPGLYDRSIKCWIDLTLASTFGPALGIEAPQRTKEATEAWHKGAIELGAMLGKDEAAVKADAQAYFAPLAASLKAPDAKLPELVPPILDRAANCEAQFTGRR